MNELAHVRNLMDAMLNGDGGAGAALPVRAVASRPAAGALPSMAEIERNLRMAAASSGPLARKAQRMLAAAVAPISRPAHGPGPIARARLARPAPIVERKVSTRPAAPVGDTRTLLQRIESLERGLGIVPPRQGPADASAMARAMGLESVAVGVVDAGDRLILGAPLDGSHARPRASSSSSGRGLSAEQIALMDRAAGAPEVSAAAFGGGPGGSDTAIGRFMARAAGQEVVVDTAFGVEVARSAPTPLSAETIRRIGGAL